MQSRVREVRSLVDTLVAQAVSEGYAFQELGGPFDKTVEIDGGDCYLRMTFGYARSTTGRVPVWRMMCSQADATFVLERVRVPQTEQLACWTERDYEGGVTLSNDHANEEITLEVRVPVSVRAIQSFAMWDAHLAGCCLELRKIMRLAQAEASRRAWSGERRVANP